MSLIFINFFVSPYSNTFHISNIKVYIMLPIVFIIRNNDAFIPESFNKHFTSEFYYKITFVHQKSLLIIDFLLKL